VYLPLFGTAIATERAIAQTTQVLMSRVLKSIQEGSDRGAPFIEQPKIPVYK
jgi:hypothetical protein